MRQLVWDLATDVHTDDFDDRPTFLTHHVRKQPVSLSSPLTLLDKINMMAIPRLALLQSTNSATTRCHQSCQNRKGQCHCNSRGKIRPYASFDSILWPACHLCTYLSCWMLLKKHYFLLSRGGSRRKLILHAVFV